MLLTCKFLPVEVLASSSLSTAKVSTETLSSLAAESAVASSFTRRLVAGLRVVMSEDEVYTVDFDQRQ